MPKPRTIPSRSTELQPYWQTLDGESVRFYLGDVVDVLKRMPEKSVHMVVTSPPYWGLRSYLPEDHASKGFEIGSEPSPDCGTMGKAQCGQCFVCKMVEVFTAVHRVLRDDGTLWLNLGSTYMPKTIAGIAAGNDASIPWRVALALQSNGWILRQDIIWQKKSPMPESCTNRCTKSHEYIFLLTKKRQYYYDADAIRTPYADSTVNGARHSADGKLCSKKKDIRTGTVGHLRDHKQYGVTKNPDVPDRMVPLGDGSNKKSVWTVASESYGGAHFAPFPQKLIEPCILAGTSEFGCCGDCGAPFVRVTERIALKRERPNEWTKYRGEEGTGNSCPNTIAGVGVKTLGWEPSCLCFGEGVILGEPIQEGGGYAAQESRGRKGVETGVGSKEVGKSGDKAEEEISKEEAENKVCVLRKTVYGEERCQVLQSGTLGQVDVEGGVGKQVSSRRHKSVSVQEDKGDIVSGSQACDGGASRKKAKKVRTHPPHERGQVRQPNRKPSSTDTSSTRADSHEPPSEGAVLPDSKLNAAGGDTPSLPCAQRGSPTIAPCTVLDIFLGSATTAIVGQKFARRVIGIELSETYLKKNAIPRIEGRLLSLKLGHLIPGKQPEKVLGVGKSLSQR